MKFVTNSVKENFCLFVKKKQVLTESVSMLDISIPSLEKSKNKLPELSKVPVEITEKTDGVKLTVLRNSKQFSKNWKENWIVSYKGNVIYPEDFSGISPEMSNDIKHKSIGTSQYTYVFEMLKRAHKQQETQNIKPNTELFFEFMMRKPTLTREYNSYHELVLLAVASTTYEEHFGRLSTKPNQMFNTKDRKRIAEILKVSTPKTLFTGTLEELTKTNNPDEILVTLKDVFLKMPSQYGGAMEGIVLEFANGDFFKIIQEDQHDKELRKHIKQKHSSKNPNYYQEIKKLASDLVFSVGEATDLKKSLKTLSLQVYGLKNDLAIQSIDPERALINIKDDLFLTAKTLLLRKLLGNNNALFVGRFSPLTIAHYNILNNALSQYDSVTVNIVKGEKSNKEQNPFPLEVQEKMLKKCFGNKIEITSTNTGNLATILQKPSKLISNILAGSDRYEGYKYQLRDNSDINVKEIPRLDDVSGTKVRQSLRENNLPVFQNNTPKQIWDMFEELQQYLS